tara:strand:- start:730 stop:1923 length:1194 start_codon:yes stop_codon:yes gene_type:complete
MSLGLIASHDDLIKLCGVDTTLADKFSNVFPTFISVFDPATSLASNPDAISGGFWTNKRGISCKRGVGTFNIEKYTKFFIETKKAYLEDPENKPDIERFGYDCYAYLMAYEEDILETYSNRDDLNNLQKAALHKVEVGLEDKPVDYLKYVATYDDLVFMTNSTKPSNQTPEAYTKYMGEMHYNSTGKGEIHMGIRPLVDFFDAVKYIASYPTTFNSFKDPQSGKVDEDKATIAYITIGATCGLPRNAFSPFIYLANNPDIVKEDIYVNEQISEKKVASIWLDKFGSGVDLTKFDLEDFKEQNKLDENEDPFKAFVNIKLREYKAELKQQNTLFKQAKSFCKSLKSKPQEIQEEVTEVTTDVKEIVVEEIKEVKTKLQKFLALFSCLKKPVATEDVKK